MRRCYIVCLVLLLLVGCANLQQEAPGASGSAPSESDGEPVPAQERFRGNVVAIEPPLGEEQPGQMRVLNDMIVGFFADGDALKVDQYDPHTLQALPEREVYRFGQEETISSLGNFEASLLVTTDSAVYRFDDDWQLTAQKQLPLYLLDEDVRLDYYRKSFLINESLTQMVYRNQGGLFRIALEEGAEPALLAEHPNYPLASEEEEVKVALYVPLSFLSDRELLVAVGGYEWWGDFAVIDLDTAELRPLFAGENPQGAIIYTTTDALAVGGEGDVVYLDYATGTTVEAPFLDGNAVSGYFYGGDYRFYNPTWFAQLHRPEGEGENTFTFHRADYAQGVVEELPFSVTADDAQIVWAGENGDVLFWYSAEGTSGYAMARAE